jgi:CO/xanthine dehydrogenase Mo-binding subunit
MPDGGQARLGLVGYLVPAASEIPSMAVVLVESELPQTQGGCRGMGSRPAYSDGSGS